MEKMTYVKALNVVLEGGVITDEIREKLEGLKASVEKRNASKGKTKSLTPTQKANISLREQILAFMVDGERYTVTDVIKGVDSLHEMSTQKVGSLLRALVEEGSVKRIEEKRKAYFTLKSADLSFED